MKLPVMYDEIPVNEKRAVRDEYKKLQENLCYFCNEPLDKKPSERVQNAPITKRFFPKRFFENPEHLHHDHNTGLTLGVVHARCNAYLWQYLGE